MNHVIVVTTLDDRHKLMNALKMRYLLKAADQPNLRIEQEKIHQLKIYEDGLLAHTITVVTVPLFCNLKPLENMAGPDTKYTISALVEAIDSIKAQLLQLVQRPPTKKGNSLDHIADRIAF